MLRRFLWFVIAVPCFVVIVAIAIANRAPARLVLDPFRPDAPVVFLELPLYAYLLAALVAGVVIGGFAAWLGQGHWRRAARAKAQEALKWQAEADRLIRERDEKVGVGPPTASRPLIAASR